MYCFVIGCQFGDEIRTWDVVRGKLIRTYDGPDHNPFSVHYVNNDTMILINYISSIKAIKESGDVIYSIQPKSDKSIMVVGGAGNTWLGGFHDQMVDLYDAKSGELKHEIVNKSMGDLSFGTDGLVEGIEWLTVTCI